jgi:hypothetical protein
MGVMVAARWTRQLLVLSRKSQGTERELRKWGQKRDLVEYSTFHKEIAA